MSHVSYHLLHDFAGFGADVGNACTTYGTVRRRRTLRMSMRTFALPSIAVWQRKATCHVASVAVQRRSVCERCRRNERARLQRVFTILSRIDYCNALLQRTPAVRSIQAAASAEQRLSYRSSSLSMLEWRSEMLVHG